MTPVMTHHDGTGAGGGTLACHFAPSGKRILLDRMGASSDTARGEV